MRTLLAFTAAALLATSASAQDVEHSFQTSVPRGQVQRVVIDVPFGEFTVRNGAAGAITVAGVASRDYDGQRERIWAQKVVDDVSVEVVVNGAEAVVRRKFGHNAQSWRAKKFTGLDLKLELPPGIDVRFETSAGEIDVAGHYGDIDVDLSAGEIDVRVPRSTVRELNASCRIGEVNTNLGSEIVTREGLLPGKTHFYNAAGRGHVNVHTTFGEVRVTLTP
jgi:opacity protein-like surface antigen